MNADAFLNTIFDQAQGVVLVVNAEDGFRGRRWKPGMQLSGATYFCISTVRDANPRDQVLQRRTQDLVLTYDIVLDDIGTKVDRKLLKGKLKPSCKVLTSQPDGVDNEQWHYFLDEGCDPARAAALVEALAQAGLTDPGARRADRIMRLPGSINSKYGKPFAARVVEWTGVFHSYSEIAHGLGVTPTDTPALGSGPPELPPGVPDPLFDWLRGHGMILGGPNPRGWYAVSCPQEHLHTGEVDHGTDYRPGMPGVFKCMHGHCQGFGRSQLVEWIRAQDPGADLPVMPGEAFIAIGAKLRGLLGVKPNSVGAEGAETEFGSEGLFETLLAQAAKGTMFAAGMETAVAVQSRAGEVRDMVLGDIIHVASESCFWSVGARCFLDAKAVDNRWYPVMENCGLLDRPKRLPMRPHEWLMQQPGMVRVARVTHRLGKPLIVDDCLNLAPMLPLAVDYSGEPGPWLELISFICKGNEEDADWLLDWMALVVSDFDEKPGFHIILKGRQGTGKNLALLPMVTYLQPEHQQLVSTAMIGGQFNAFLAKRLLVINELKMTTRGAATAHDIYNNLKAWTARDADTITINEKNMKHFQAADRSCWAITSNEGVPLPIEDDDRRFMVIETPRRPMPPEFYKRIADWLADGGQDMVIGYLQQRWREMTTVERQALRETAPMTEAKRELVDDAAEGIAGAIRLSISGKHGAAWPDLMKLEDVMDKLKLNADNLLSDAAKKMITVPRVAAALKSCGAVRLFGGERVRDGERNKLRLWCMRPLQAAHYESMKQGKELADAYATQRSGIDSAVRDNIYPFKGPAK